MADARLGVKRSCTSCGARFYDLCKMPVECPKCEASFVPEILLPAKQPRPSDAKAFSNRTKSPGMPRKNQNAELVVSAEQDDDDEKPDSADEEMAAVSEVDLGDGDAAAAVSADDDRVPEIESEEAPDLSGLVDSAPNVEKSG